MAALGLLGSGSAVPAPSASAEATRLNVGAFVDSVVYSANRPADHVNFVHAAEVRGIATLEHRPVERLILKLEARYHRSSSLVFATDELGADGSALRKRNPFLLLPGAVATF